MALTLSSDDIAALGRIVHGRRVLYVRTDGDDGDDGLTPDTAKLTVDGATAISATGDLVLIGAGTYAITDAEVALTAAVTYRGAGMGQTTISGTSGAATKTLVNPAADTVIEDMTITCTDYYACGWSSGNSATNARGVILRRVELTGTKDDFVCASGGTTKSDALLVDCVLNGPWDKILITTHGAIECIRCRFDSVLNHCGYNLNAHASNPQELIFRDCTFIAQGAQNYRVFYAWAISTGLANITAINCTLRVLQEAANEDIEAHATGAAATITLVNCLSDGKFTEVTSGTVTNILREAGAGSIVYTLTVDDGTDPLDGVEVWITTDVAGDSVITSGTTDASGEVVFYLDAGTYYAWKQLSGYNFTNPETLTVS